MHVYVYNIYVHIFNIYKYVFEVFSASIFFVLFNCKVFPKLFVFALLCPCVEIMTNNSHMKIIWDNDSG